MHIPGDDEIGGFPTISDFSVVLSDSRNGEPRHVDFVSSSSGHLAHFPAWEHADRDLRHFVAADVPMGSFDEPYDEGDEGWRIVIFERRGFVYVMEADAPDAKDFPRFFRVPATRYLQAWAALIDRFNPITPLDEAE